LFAAGEGEKLPFPSVSDLNARLRKLITAFQKNYKKELLKQELSEKVRQSFVFVMIKKYVHFIEPVLKLDSNRFTPNLSYNELDYA